MYLRACIEVRITLCLFNCFFPWLFFLARLSIDRLVCMRTRTTDQTYSRYYPAENKII
ncbi:hypothetical protein BDV33DRAFT_165964 [Aspergillus novoparasiticus]|uniref:Uncharacterized protein n=1 Tax=Aspergillus novoparasiticus TaxID=986946 RepID=A0A5N6F5K1_9EURO|nr:hypothetical protein BDV33DRAFT_165964 [Aspergillus novoparasiticus]